MPRVFAEISVSLDGFAAGPEISPEHPLGRNGGALHEWLIGEAREAADTAAAQAMFAETGAFVMGRRTFDIGEPLWGEDGAFGMPCVVLTRRGRPDLIRGPTRFAFVTDGLAAGLAAARAAAGDKNVCVMGGPATVGRFVAAGLVDELRLHVAPVMLGAGTRPFDGVAGPQAWLPVAAAQSRGATHLQFRRP